MSRLRRARFGQPPGSDKHSPSLSRLGHVPGAVMNVLSLLCLAPTCQSLIKSSPNIVLI